MRELRGRGYAYSDIAVLTRTNESVAAVSSWLNEKDIPFIPYSSLDIRGRKVIGEVLAVLAFLDAPPDDLAFAAVLLGDAFGRAAGEREFPLEERRRFLFECRTAGRSPLYVAFRDRRPALWARLFEPLFQAVGYYPLYDLAVSVYRAFDLFASFPGEEAALTRFLEAIKGFEGKGRNDLREFLAFTGEEGAEAWTIDVPETIDAVKVMTIHKAKGLGFPVVILLVYPERWRPPDFFLDEGEDGIRVLKINKSLAAADDDLKRVYEEARLRDQVNSLNTLYVALTRAESELYIVGVMGKTPKFPFDVLGDAFRSAEDRPPIPRREPKSAGEPAALNRLAGVFEAPFDSRQSLNEANRRRGEFAHRIMAEIEYVEGDWPAAAAEAASRIDPRFRASAGAAPDEDSAGLVEAIAAFFACDPAAGLFRPRPDRRVLREANFCDAAGRSFRMDRVVVDAGRGPRRRLQDRARAGPRRPNSGPRLPGAGQGHLSGAGRARCAGLHRPGRLGGGRMSVVLVPPREGLVASVLGRLAPQGKDYTRYWVVFPERRPGYYLRKALAEREGTAFLPPRIDSMDAFVDRVHRERLGRRERSIDALDAAALLFEIHRGEPGRLGGGHFLTADQFFPLAAKLFRDLEEMAGSSVAPEALARSDGWSEERIPETTRQRLQSLSLFYERFYETLARRGYSTSGSRLRDVVAALEPSLFEGVERIVLAGFFPTAGGEADILRTMADWPGVDVLLQEGAGVEKALERIGAGGADLRARAQMAEALAPAADIEIVESPDVHGQVFALNAALAPALADPGRLDETRVIVLPAAETLFPLHQQTLAALPPEAYNISLGYPLARTPISGFFDRLIEILQSADEEGRVYAPHYLRFLLHPYTKNIFFGGLGVGEGTGFDPEGPGKKRKLDAGDADGNRELRILYPFFSGRADLTRILVHAVEDQLVARRTRAFWSLDELVADAGVREAVAERSRGVEGAPDPAAFMAHLASLHAALIVPFREIRDVREFSSKLCAALAHIYEHSTARRHVFFHPYAEAFMDRLEALGRSLLGPTVFEDRTSYFNLFRKVIAAGTVPFEGVPLRGLQALGFWETRGLPFRDVSILDLNEDVLPAAQRVDSLLPFAARRALGLPTYKDAERRAAYHLDALLRGADRVRIFYVKSKDRRPSRFVERLIWERQKREREMRASRFVRRVRYQVALQEPPLEPVPKGPEVAAFLQTMAFSATALDAYLRCPLQFHRRYVLGLKEREDLGEEMEAKDVGSFVHSILEEYFGRFVGRDLHARDLDPAGLAAVVERRFEESFGPEPSGGLYLMRRQTLAHLGEFLTGYQAPAAAGMEREGKALRILGLEKKLSLEWNGTPSGKLFRLTAKVDRMELRGDELYVLDYKTSGNPKYLGIAFDKLDLDDRPSWSEHAASVQLPFYHLVLARTPLPPPAKPEKIRCAFLLLGRKSLGPGIEWPAFAGGREMRALDKLLASPDTPAVERDRALVERARLEAERASLTESLIGRLLDEIADPAHPFDPALRRPDACDRCPTAGMCGR